MPKGQSSTKPLAASTVRTLSQVEAAWIGAMIEAEGSVNFRQDTRLLCFITLTNTDLEIISTLLRVVGDGRVTYRRVGALSPFSKKEQWVWSLNKTNSVRRLAEQIMPFMTEKGKKLRTWLHQSQ